MQNNKTYKILSLLLIMQWAFVQIIAQYPNFIEKYYSNGVFQSLSKMNRIIFGWLPFSLGDVLYALVIVIFFKNIYAAFKHKKYSLKNTLFKIGGIASVVYFLFHLFWGLNYFRPSLFDKFSYKKGSYSVEELTSFTDALIVKINTTHRLSTKNDTLIISSEFNKKELKNKAALAFLELEKKHPQFGYNTTSVKHSIFSLPLTYMGFSGYLNPITLEAQINSLNPKSTYPATVCHEIAHQIGTASESEANFIGYLAAINAKDPYINYSGYLMALRYCLFEVYQKDASNFEVLKNKLNTGILKDMKNNQDFWRSYQNWSEKYFKLFYDSYLKVNKQKDGIQGYNKVVLLLINYYLNEEL